MPTRVLDVAASDSPVFAALKARRDENRESVERLELTADRFVAAMPATRALIRTRACDAPPTYFASVVRNPFDKWLNEARRWIKAQASPACHATYSSHGQPK